MFNPVYKIISLVIWIGICIGSYFAIIPTWEKMNSKETSNKTYIGWLILVILLWIMIITAITMTLIQIFTFLRENNNFYATDKKDNSFFDTFLYY